MPDLVDRALWTILQKRKINKGDPWTFAAERTTAATRKTGEWEETETGRLLEDEELGLLAFEVLFYTEGNVKKALELASEGVRLYAESRSRAVWTRWRLNAGKACGVLGLRKDAENHFRMVLNVGGNIEAFRELARVHYMEKDWAKCMETLREGLEAFPSDTRLLCLLAKLTKDKATYMKALKIDPSSREALLALGGQHFDENEPETALKFFQRLLELHGPSAALWNNIALAAVYSNQTDVGIPAFEQALLSSEGATKGDIWFNVACFAALDGDFQFTRVALNLAVSLNPNHAEALVNLGLLELHEGNLMGAKHMLERAIFLNPLLFEAVYNSALVNYQLSRMDLALKHVEEALRLFPDHPQTLTLRSLIKSELYK